MYTTVKDSAFQGNGVVGAAVATAAIAFGMAYFAVSATVSEEAEEMDTTTRLLSGGNRDRILDSLRQYEQGRFIKHKIPADLA